MKASFPTTSLALCLLAIGPLPAVADEEASAPPPPLSTEELIAQVKRSVATIRVGGRDGDPIGVGTGFVIDPGGLIATNLHVIDEGRPFTVEMSGGRTLSVLSIEASDRASDLALVRVDVKEQPLPALTLAQTEQPPQGLRVLALGNPLGLRGSVVEGIVSAVREVDGHKLIQLAMPIETGNSGGPVVDGQGRVHGIVNMKSAVDDNLGFAIPIGRLQPLRDKPNPVTYDRWVLLGRINTQNWTPLFGAKWQQRGGTISARGLGRGFGGRSLCLSTQDTPPVPYDVEVMVKLDDESGAAGLAFCSDGGDRHYGFYPSNGRLRLTCFKGPTVYSWQVLNDEGSKHYLPGQWNRLRVRVQEDRFLCFVNEQLVLDSPDRQLTAGKIGLVKFRNTNPDFKGFRVGKDLEAESLSEFAENWLADWDRQPAQNRPVSSDEIERLSESSEAASREILRRAMKLEQQAQRMRKLAADVQLAPTLGKLRELFAQSRKDEDSDANPNDNSLLIGALLIAALDDTDVDVEAYSERVDAMAAEIQQRLKEKTKPAGRLAALDNYLFKENGFHGGRVEYYHPANSHLNRVIDEREGLPITLSILYMELGRRIGLNIDGIGLPGHFVVAHVVDGKDDAETTQLIDVFDGGTRLSRRDAAAIVGRRLTEEDLRPQTTPEILTRVLRNLIGVASSNRDSEALRRYCEALVAVEPSSVEFRWMRAQIRALTDRNTAAIEDLDWLLEKDPPGFSRPSAQRMRDTLLQQE